MTETASTPSVLFVCVKNGGKSQMAAGLMRKIAVDAVHVYSAGTSPGTAFNDHSAQSLAEVGVDISDQTPQPVDPQLLRDVDIVVTLGREAHVEPVAGTKFENWDTDEPSERGVTTSQTASPICSGACRRSRLTSSLETVGGRRAKRLIGRTRPFWAEREKALAVRGADGGRKGTSPLGFESSCRLPNGGAEGRGGLAWLLLS
jgi:arsenate-mycothiol transferase